jgi:hypothetical protein
MILDLIVLYIVKFIQPYVCFPYLLQLWLYHSFGYHPTFLHFSSIHVLICVQEMLRLKFLSEHQLPWLKFLWFASACPGKHWDNTLRRPQLLLLPLSPFDFIECSQYNSVLNICSSWYSIIKKSVIHAILPSATPIYQLCDFLKWRITSITQLFSCASKTLVCGALNPVFQSSMSVTDPMSWHQWKIYSFCLCHFYS